MKQTLLRLTSLTLLLGSTLIACGGSPAAEVLPSATLIPTPTEATTTLIEPVEPIETPQPEEVDLAGTDDEATPATRAVSSSSAPVLSDEQLAAFITFIEDSMQTDTIPGAAVAIVHGNDLIFVKGFGLRNIDSGEPVTPETLFHIASTNKSMTAMMIATLVDEGLFEWDTPVVELYPDFELSDPEATQQVTMRHLLSMRGGIPADAEDELDYATSTTDDVLEIIAGAPLLGMPGEVYDYSNLSYTAAAYAGVLAAGGGEDALFEGYADLLQQCILDPIGMETATVYGSEAKSRPDHATSYFLDETGQLVEAESEDFDGDATAPSGILKANVTEMALYVSTQINEGVAPNGTRVVSAENLTETWQPYLENYGMGWEIDEYEELKIISHTGFFDNFASVIGFLPERNLGFAILTNADTGVDFTINAPYAFVDALNVDQ